MKTALIKVGDKVSTDEGRALGPATVLAIDPDCDCPRGAAWIRFDPKGEHGHHRYRSVDLCDLAVWEDGANFTYNEGDQHIRKLSFSVGNIISDAPMRSQPTDFLLPKHRHRLRR